MGPAGDLAGRIAGRYIVMLKQNATDRREDMDAAVTTATEHAADMGAMVRHVYRHALYGYSASMTARTAAKLADEPGVLSVQQDRWVRATAQSVPTGVNRVDADLSPTASIDGVDKRVNADVAVIDIGHERTDVVVVHQNKAVFSRSVARAGKQVTEKIAAHWKMPWSTAEQAKHSDGFIASAAEPPTSEQWDRISRVLAPELGTFARDIRQTLAACRARTGFAPIARSDSTAAAKFERSRSTPFTKASTGTPARSAARHMLSVPTLTPSTAETSRMAPSRASSAIWPSAWKFGSPGVSTRVRWWPSKSKPNTAEESV